MHTIFVGAENNSRCGRYFFDRRAHGYLDLGCAIFQDASLGETTGIQLRVTNDGGDFQVDVLLLSEVRGPASAAQTLYRETAESREKCEKVAAERRAMRQFEVLPEGRVA
jgi:hypothetical protein